MPTVHRQLRDWCRRRGYSACEAFASRLDEELVHEAELTPDVLLSACRRIHDTRFFRENNLDPEVVAQALSSYLDMPRVRARLVKRTPARPEDPRSVNNPADDPPDLFVSYYHEDRDFVEALAKQVAEGGFEVWYDQRGLSAGDSFPREIERAVGSARRIGVVCTPDSLDRPWVRKEMDAGHTREGSGEGDILIPLRLESCELPALLAPKNWCDFTSGFEPGLTDLLTVLRK